MMKKIYKKSQLLEVNNIPTEVIEGIKATIDVLNENYGADRDIELDLGGSILENFSKVLTESTTREQHKKLLHMIISEITINEAREIDSIKLKINDSLVDYISKEEGVSIKGTPSSFMLRNVGIKTLNLNIEI
jgi:site-specific DNA recombinase